MLPLKTRLVVVTLVVAMLAAPAPAPAKGPISLELCGVSACRTFAWVPSERANERLVHGVVALHEDFAFVSAPPLAPYYALQLEADWYEWDSVFYLPAHGVAEVQSSWLRVPRPLASALRAATAGLDPQPRPTLARVVVNGRPAADPPAYGAVFDRLPKAAPPPPETPRARIRLATGARTPWTDEPRAVDYVPTADLLHREAEWVRAPADLAQLIEDDLRAGAAEKRSAWPSYLSLAALLAGAGGVVWLRRARRRLRASAT